MSARGGRCRTRDPDGRSRLRPYISYGRWQRRAYGPASWQRDTKWGGRKAALSLFVRFLPLAYAGHVYRSCGASLYRRKGYYFPTGSTMPSRQREAEEG